MAEMKRYIVLSVNDNPDYLYFTPLTCWAWRKLGWEPIVMYQRNLDMPWLLDGVNVQYNQVLGIDGYRSDTITQISRLYAACVGHYVPEMRDAYLMTGDIDMVPLSDYWKDYDEKQITIWGHDLTGYGHYPICYIGMPSSRWIEVMCLGSPDYNALIKRDLDTLPQAKDPDFYKYWFSDQDLITKRINDTQFPKNFINRGQHSNGYAVGRVDRGAWSLDHKQFIDAHLFQQVYHKGREDKFERTIELLTTVWPKEDFSWFIEYHLKFQKLTGHA